jgi:hypothetical protein
MYQASSIPRLVAIAAFGLIQLACPHHQDQVRPIGPQVKASLVIYFKQSVADQQIEDFWHEVLSTPDPEGRGYYHRDGVGDISRIYPVQGHEGISMTFFPDATKEERIAVESDIRSSPIVYKIFENVAPADIKKID